MKNSCLVCYFGSMVLLHTLKLWKRPSELFWVRYRFLAVSPLSFQLSESDLALVFYVIDRSFAYSHPLPPPFTTYLRCFHPPATATFSKIRHYVMKAACQSATQSALLLALRNSTQHSIVSQPQTTEEQHGFIHFWRQRPATVSKNCSCVLTTSRLTVSPTSVSTRKD